MPELRFVDFVYLPVVEAGATRSGVIAHASDVTGPVQARREIERLLAGRERARRDAGVVGRGERRGDAALTREQAQLLLRRGATRRVPGRS